MSMSAVYRGAPQPRTMSRVTVGGRKLLYQLTVLQQPERARACGSGAKSSADRRPVDPPPVVELHIFEQVEGHPDKDITFSYEANFFLFATLENARPIAHGRGQPSNTSVPVLTGMPVSGMAYLDRPKEAGYFIFPDLSVRHEGKYILSFNLYEQTGRDEDVSIETQSERPAVAGDKADSSFDWRLEVKSVPFMVFSAKKFPGLAESTPLSRTVAEQGCRVRIRRDVRMRRRDGKAGNDDYDEAVPYERVGMSQQPSYDGPRSISNSPTPSERRNSGEYPHAPSGGHLNFGQNDRRGPPPASFAQPPLPMPSRYPSQYPSQQAFQTPSLPPHHPNEHRPSPFPPHPNDHRAPNPPHVATRHYSYDREAYPHSAHPSSQPRDLEIPAPGYRRASDLGYATTASRPAPYEPSNRTPFSSHYRPSSPDMKHNSLPPLKLHPEPRYDHRSSIANPMSVKTLAPAPPTLPAFEERKHSIYSAPVTRPITPETMRSGKRSFDTAYPHVAAREYSGSLHNHKRPETLHQYNRAAVDADEEMIEPSAMSYKRADGSTDERDCPEIQ